MNTLLLCPELFARESGIQRILRLYLKALCEAAQPGDEVRLVVLNDREFPAAALQRYATDHLVRRHPCGRSKLGFLRHALGAAAGVDRLVCGHLGQLPVAWIAHRLHPRLRYYLVAHGIEVWRPYSILERLALRGARGILCVSDYTRREMRRRIALPESRFALVPNALDPFFEPVTPDAARSAAVAEILTVARLDAGERYKGVDHLLEAMPAVLRALPAARLRVIGAGSDLPRLQELAAQLRVTAAVEFSGFVGDDELRAAYRRCALFALPSRRDGFGIVFLEAMANGKPCLGARAGALPEIISDVSGVLVPYGDVGQIAAQLVGSLQRMWDPGPIRDHARQFSYPAFKERLRAALAS
jgi:phosphatidylinositol alpha-1,6-mannosyltransferase